MKSFPALKKTCGALIVTLLIITSVVVAPRPAHAALPVVDFLNLVANNATAVSTGVTAAGTTANALKEHVNDGIFWVIGRIAIQSLTNSLVHWINSGFQGSPGFVTNLGNTLTNVADTVATNYLKELATTGSISSPFQTQVAQAAQQNYFQSTGPGGLFSQHPFSLSQASPNPTAFLNGDFSQGGFNALFSATLNPANNPQGAAHLAQNELADQVVNAQKTRLTELNWGKGFLSWRGSCAASGEVDSGSLGGKACTTNDDCAGQLACIAGKCSVDKTLDDPVSLTGGDTCLAYNIQTPGSVIESQLEKTFGSNVDSLVTADEFNEVIGALMGQLMNHVLGGGGLAGLSQPTGTGTSSASFIDQATSPSQLAGTTQSIATSFAGTINTQEGQIRTFIADWQKINTAALAAKQTCTTAGNQATITSTVQPVIDTSTVNLASAASTITALEKIKTEAAATPAAGSDPTISVLQASTEYTTLLSSDPILSTIDTAVQAAAAESTDTGTSTPSSTYSKMTQLAQNNCQLPT